VVVCIVSYSCWRIYKEKVGLNLKAVAHAVIWLSAFLRLLYFVTDPFGQTRVVPFVFEQLIFGYAYFCIFTSFLLVLLFWAGAYHFDMKSKGGSLFFSKMKPVFIIVDVIWFIIEFVFRMFCGLHKQNIIREWETFDTAYNVYTALICAIFTGGFAIYGGLLVRDLRKVTRSVGTDRIRKLTESVLILSITFFVCVIALLAVIVTNAIYFPEGAIASFSVAHVLEGSLMLEMTYIMRAGSSSGSSGSSGGTSSTGMSSLGSSRATKQLNSSTSSIMTSASEEPISRVSDDV